MSWKGKNVLVTGASGLVGSALVGALSQEGARVVALVRDMNIRQGQLLVSPGTTLVRGDVSDYRFMREVVSTYEVDVVFHMAAYAIVRVAASDPLTTYQTNVMGTVALLEAVRNVGRPCRVVVASSDKAYGDHLELPYLETHALEPRNTYDTSKACADMVARTYALNYDMDVVVTRSSNIYGPGDGNLSRIVPNTIRRLYDGRPPMLYSDIEGMEREFIYIDDVVRAYLLLGLGSGDAGEAYNIGGTGPMRIRDLVDTICVIAGAPEASCEVVPRAPAFREIARQYLDASKMAEAYGWAPQTPIQLGLRKTVEAYWNVFQSSDRAAR